MSLGDFHTAYVGQTSGKGTFQLSATGGTFEGFVTLSGGGAGFVNIYDSANGLPLPAAGRVIASGVQVSTALPHDNFQAELNSGLYVEAYGPVQATFRWE